MAVDTPDSSPRTTEPAPPVARRSRTARTLRAVSRAAAIVAIATGALVLVGWALGITALTSILPGLSSMKPITAIACIACGVSLWAVPFARAVPGRIARGAAGGVVVIAIITIAEYALGRELLLDSLVSPSGPPTPASPYPGRMGLNTAIAFALIGVALLAKRRRLPRLAEACASGAFLVALVPLIGDVYSAQSITGIASFTQMALHTAGVLMVLALGVAAMRPRGPFIRLMTSAGPGGVMLQWLLPTYAVLLVVLGWLRLYGQERGYFGLHAGLAGMVVIAMTLFAVGLTWVARAVNRTAANLQMAERVAREQAARHHDIVEATFDGVLISERGIIREVNATAAAMFGYTLQELIGMPAAMLAPPERREGAAERVGAGFRRRYEAPGYTKDGRTLMIEAVTKPQGPASAERWLVAFRDVTAQRRMEERLTQSHKMEAVGRLAGGVAHDFNNLLTVIASYSDLVLQDAMLDDANREAVAHIQEAAQSAAALTKQLLAFSRQQPMQRSTLSLNAVVMRAERMLTRLIGEDVTLRTSLAADLAPIVADGGQIEQVIINLVANARDAMPEGGSVVIETANITIVDAPSGEVSVAGPGRHVQLTVSDTGVGMDAETQRHVFEPFFTTKEHGKGVGLGLATVYGIVEQSGGRIWVYSEVAHGTTFKLYFPATEAALEPARPRPPVPASLLGTETVLLVEDARLVRAVARKALERYGYAVLEAEDGVGALSTAARHEGPIHLLLTDIVLPGMNGREIAERLTALRPAMKVVFMSGYTNDALLQHGMAQLGGTLLQKPYTTDVLARKVRETLDGEQGSNPRSAQ